MGGPCYLVASDGTTTPAPPVTDNFFIRPFLYHGTRFYSVEAAFQACKHGHGSAKYAEIAALAPEAGETDAEHGLRAWRVGQGGGPLRPDWSVFKINLMLDLVRNRTAQHADLQEQLLATGTTRLRGQPSTCWKMSGVDMQWGHFNGLIMMLVREELRRESAGGSGQMGALEAEIRAALQAYEVGDPGSVLAAFERV